MNAIMENKKHVFTKKLVSEGLPEKKGWYYVNDPNYPLNPKDKARFDPYNKSWFTVDGDGLHPDFWLQDEGEKHVLSDEELRTLMTGFTDFLTGYCPTKGAEVTWTKEYYQNKERIFSTKELIELYLTTKQDEPI